MDSTFKPGPDSNDGFCSIGSFQIVSETLQGQSVFNKSKTRKRSWVIRILGCG